MTNKYHYICNYKYHNDAKTKIRIYYPNSISKELEIYIWEKLKNLISKPLITKGKKVNNTS